MNIAIIFSIVNISYFIFVYFSRNYRWVYIDNAVVKFIEGKYMKKFDALDNTKIEAL
jgi:uncharacterized membrane protein YukC